MYDYIIPPRRRPRDDNGYFEILCQGVFQAGFPWKIVQGKWPNFQKAFYRFHVDKVAQMKLRDVERLLKDPGIIRNTAKIIAVVENARIFQNIQKEHGSFKSFLASFRKLSYPKRRDILAKTFRWIGPTGAFHFFWCTLEKVPEWEERNQLE